MRYIVVVYSSGSMATSTAVGPSLSGLGLL